MESMRRIVQHAAGGPEVLTLEDAPIPSAGPTEILIRVRAASVNPTDVKSRARGSLYFGEQPPFTLGYDVSGVVAATGLGVTHVDVGDEVYGMLRFPHSGNTYAEYTTAPSRQVLLKPPALSHVEAAALPLAAMTAWQALVDLARLAPGETVLIHAGAGGVGHLAVQVAKARGARVVATASAENHAFLFSLGADAAIDYRTSLLTRGDGGIPASGVDVVLDTLGGSVVESSLRVLAPGGRLVSLIPTGLWPKQLIDTLGVFATRILVEPDQETLRAVDTLVRAEELHPTVSATFPLADVAEAHRLSEIGHTRGKIVLIP